MTDKNKCLYIQINNKFENKFHVLRYLFLKGAEHHEILYIYIHLKKLLALNSLHRDINGIKFPFDSYDKCFKKSYKNMDGKL